MTNVVGLRGMEVPEPDIDEKNKAEIVARCETWLEMAKRGEFTSVGICSVNSNGQIMSGWQWGPGQKFILAGSASLFSHELATAVLASCKE